MRLEPVVQRCIGSFSEAAGETALTPQACKLTRSRAGNDEPCRLDAAVPDDLRPLQHEGAVTPIQAAAESLHADHARSSIGTPNLQSANVRLAFEISSKDFFYVDLDEGG